MRYNLYCDYLFIKVEHDGFGRVWEPEAGPICEIKLMKLRSQERLWVSANHREDSVHKSEAYSFVNQTDQTLWLNQHPTAVYGRFEDQNDWVVRKAWKGSAPVHSKEYEDCMFGYYDIRRYLCIVKEWALGQRQDPEFKARLTPALMKAMAKHEKDICAKLYGDYGMHVLFTPLMEQNEQKEWLPLRGAVQVSINKGGL
jgi:hypothetical protein